MFKVCQSMPFQDSLRLGRLKGRYASALDPTFGLGLYLGITDWLKQW